MNLLRIYLIRVSLEMLELINKIFIHLDTKWAIDIRNDGQDNIVYRISESLKILNYPSQFDAPW
jgi:intraflagellar transport protein 81